MAARVWFARTFPWIAVLLLVAVFQILRAAWVDAAIFGVACLLALVPASAHERRAGQASAVMPPRWAILIPVATALGVALFFAPRHGVIAGTILAAVGLLVAALARVARPAAPRPHPRALAAGVSAWVVVIVIAGLWEASAYLLQRWMVLAPGTMPAISELADPVLDSAWGKAVFLLLWLAAGVALVRRGWRRA